MPQAPSLNLDAPSPEPVDSKPHRDADLSRYGIIARQHTSYEWNGYRYSSASDAIAAAKRAAR